MDKEFKYETPNYSCVVVMDVDWIPCGYNYKPATHIVFRYVYDESGTQPTHFKSWCINYVSESLSDVSNTIPNYKGE